MSDKSSPATSHPSGRTSHQPGSGHPAGDSPASHPAGDSDEAQSALQAVQEAMDRRDNGGAADRPVPADSAQERGAS